MEHSTRSSEEARVTYPVSQAVPTGPELASIMAIPLASTREASLGLGCTASVYNDLDQDAAQIEKPWCPCPAAARPKLPRVGQEPG